MTSLRWTLLGAAGLSAAFLLTGCGGSDTASSWDNIFPGKPHIDEEWKPGFEVLSFEELYGTNCRACHADERPDISFKRGPLGAAISMNDPLYLALVDDATLTQIIAEGVEDTSMPPYAIRNGGPLTNQQIETMVKTMRERWGDPEVAKAHPNLPPYRAPLGDPAAGEAAYATYCAHCHGPDGTGLDGKAHSIVDPNYLGLVSDQGLRTILIVGRKDFGMPDYTGYVEGKPMSSQEVSDVVAWLASKREKVWSADDATLDNPTQTKPTPRSTANPADMPGQPYGDKPDSPGLPDTTAPPPSPEAPAAAETAPGDAPSTGTDAPAPAPDSQKP